MLLSQIIVITLLSPENSFSDEGPITEGEGLQAHLRPNQHFSKILRRVGERFPHLVQTVETSSDFSGDFASGGGESLKISENFDNSWFGIPKRVGYETADWSLSKEEVPNARNVMKLVPIKTQRRAFPLALPLSFTNDQVNNFFNSQVKLNDGQKVFLPSDLFNNQYMNSNVNDSKLIIIEKLLKKDLREVLAQKTLLSESFKKLESLCGMINQPIPPNINWGEEINGLRDLCYLSNNIAARSKLMSITSNMLVKSSIRDSLLARCSGPLESKEAAKFSAFGTPSLFGPTNSDLSAKCRDTHYDSQRYRLKTPSAKRPLDFSSYTLSSPAAKRGGSQARGGNNSKQNTPQVGSTQSVFRGARGGTPRKKPFPAKKRGG